MKMQVVGIEDVQNKLDSMHRMVLSVSQDVRDVANGGRVVAQALAPIYTGALRNAITTQHFERESWIVSAPGLNDNGFPINVVFNTGDFGKMTMWAPKGAPIVGIDKGGHPRTPFVVKDPSTVGFFTQAYEYLEKEIPKRLNLKVQKTF